MNEENILNEEVKQDEIMEQESEEVVGTTSETEDMKEDAVTENETDASIETSSSPSTDELVAYHERYYLKYGEGKRNSALDLDGTKAFLQEIAFDGGELRKAREGKNYAENLRNAEQNKNNQMYCSYCGAEIAGTKLLSAAEA